MEIPKELLKKTLMACERFDSGDFTVTIKFKIIGTEEGKPVKVQVKESKEKVGWFMGGYNFFLFKGIGVVGKDPLVELIKEKFASRQFTTDKMEAGKLYKNDEEIFALVDPGLIKAISLELIV